MRVNPSVLLPTEQNPTKRSTTGRTQFLPMYSHGLHATVALLPGRKFIFDPATTSYLNAKGHREITPPMSFLHLKQFGIAGKYDVNPREKLAKLSFPGKDNCPPRDDFCVVISKLYSSERPVYSEFGNIVGHISLRYMKDLFQG
ncbi:hypothetical protein GX48_02331 [Paracoccidioides brasiliensis]|nr:hypothetical protein GX48_02331 [Paracoccidioides brasiliensis]